MWKNVELVKLASHAINANSRKQLQAGASSREQLTQIGNRGERNEKPRNVVNLVNDSSSGE